MSWDSYVERAGGAEDVECPECGTLHHPSEVCPECGFDPDQYVPDGAYDDYKEAVAHERT